MPAIRNIEHGSCGRATNNASQGKSLAAWKGHKWGQGWGVYALPFSSGHVLTLQVFPQNDFSPYVTIWHHDPQGTWSIYVHGPAMTPPARA